MTFDADKIDKMTLSAVLTLLTAVEKRRELLKEKYTNNKLTEQDSIYYMDLHDLIQVINNKIDKEIDKYVKKD